MKTVLEKRLFWFLKEGTELDVSDQAHLEGQKAIFQTRYACHPYPAIP
jgi:hypothetical protein